MGPGPSSKECLLPPLSLPCPSVKPHTHTESHMHKHTHTHTPRLFLILCQMKTRCRTQPPAPALLPGKPSSHTCPCVGRSTKTEKWLERRKGGLWGRAAGGWTLALTTVGSRSQDCLSLSFSEPFFQPAGNSLTRQLVGCSELRASLCTARHEECVIANGLCRGPGLA